MVKQNQQVSKPDVQSTELNKMPVPELDETQLSAEQSAKVFEQSEGETEQAEQNER